MVRRRSTWLAVVVLAALLVPAGAPGHPAGAGILTVAAVPSPGSARPVLSLGDRGEAVRALQERLRALHASIAVDGRFGSATRRAVLAFQAARGLTADGVVGPRTWQALDTGGPTLPAGGGTAPPASSSARPILRLGSTGPAVATAQKLLTGAGQHLAADGQFGPATNGAVVSFQRARRIGVDGIIGPVTWAALSPGSGTAGPIAMTRPPWRTIGARSYVVQRADTLASVAKATGSTATALGVVNRIPSSGRLTVGATILVPGTWRCPAPGAGFIDDFDYPRTGHLHQGNDMFAPRNTPIIAPVGGRVERREGGLGGHALQLYGADGNRYYFAHLDHFGSTGSVTAGTVIGYIGNSGDASTTVTHLHFEIHPGGAATGIDPFPTLTLACKH